MTHRFARIKNGEVLDCIGNLCPKNELRNDTADVLVASQRKKPSGPSVDGPEGRLLKETGRSGTRRRFVLPVGRYVMFLLR
jgi:hypothetical protein